MSCDDIIYSKLQLLVVNSISCFVFVLFPKSIPPVFDQVRDENNKLWKKVRYVREAVLDGDNLEMISARAAKQTKYLDQVRTCFICFETILRQTRLFKT